MKLKEYFKEQAIRLAIRCMVFIFVGVILDVLGVQNYGIIFVLFLLVGMELILFMFDYMRRSQFYREVEKQEQALEKKYLLAEIIEKPSFFEGIFLYDLLRKTNKSMNDHIGVYKRSSTAYREYIETWIHEVKTPIAASRLILSNHPSSTSKSLEQELDKIEGYVEQTLFYARSNEVEKDYLIKAVSLEELVKSVVKKNASTLIESKVAIQLGYLNEVVYTDRKWMDFILGQVVSNAIKYRSEEPCLHFEVIKFDNSIVLQIKDNGIGINEKDLPRVFEKGFTGENGRLFGKSTGIGLYLCDKLCSKLGLMLKVESPKHEGCIVSITFPKSKMQLLEA